MFYLVLQGLVHEVDSGASSRQLIGDGPQNLDGRLVEREKVPKLKFSDAIRPCESALVMEIVVAYSLRVFDFPYTR
ncbi:hypothetical protein ES703_86003 [subsurface metagenome]